MVGRPRPRPWSVVIECSAQLDKLHPLIGCRSREVLLTSEPTHTRKAIEQAGGFEAQDDRAHEAVPQTGGGRDLPGRHELATSPCEGSDMQHDVDEVRVVEQRGGSASTRLSKAVGHGD
jgi:hypothetical protein